MGILVTWDNVEQTVIRWDFEQLWTNEDLYFAQQATMDLIKHDGLVIDLILNMNDTSHFPKRGMPVLKNVIQRCSQGVGVVVLVGSNSFVELMLKTQSKFDRKLGEGVTFVDRLNEAQELLAD